MSVKFFGFISMRIILGRLRGVIASQFFLSKINNKKTLDVYFKGVLIVLFQLIFCFDKLLRIVSL